MKTPLTPLVNSKTQWNPANDMGNTLPLPDAPAASSKRWRRAIALWDWLQQRAKQQARKQLRICETVSLGDKRFLALVQVEGERFLIGGSAHTVSLLAQLGSPTNSTAVLPSPQLQPERQPA